jgi:tetratricopeptide (TPR) repeat protein
VTEPTTHWPGRRDLDAALDHATQATKLAPDNPGYLDTLAEIHFQRGDKDKAIAALKKCIAMDPKRTYFTKQLKRFEAGDPKAELPMP